MNESVQNSECKIEHVMGCSLPELQLLCLGWVCQDTPPAAQMASAAEQGVLCQEHAWKSPVLVG